MVVVEVVGGRDLESGAPVAFPLRGHTKPDDVPMTRGCGKSQRATVRFGTVQWCLGAQGSSEFWRLNYKALATLVAS